MRSVAMPEIRIANAPCSWGVMTGFGDDGSFPSYEQVLDEIAATGYAGTELGDWGFMPTDAAVLSSALKARGLAMVGALVPLSLADPSSHAPGVATALRTARLIAACGGDPFVSSPGAPHPLRAGPFIILADDNGADSVRTKFAGRIRSDQGLTPSQWKTFAAGADLIARAVRDKTGLPTVFHHHCAGFVETPEETERLLDMTDADLLGLCFDTGHYAYAGGDALDGLRRFGERIWHVHFKDCHPDIADRARAEEWDYFTAVRNGVFYGVGGGQVDFAALLDELHRRHYDGWIVVEDELPPGMGEPAQGARRDRGFLRALGV